ncbi:RNA-binding protein 44 [Ochotona curzoniae]|uniref:RNA-binding protein 44 n=1 Tax=Ochotona curzoniae TaxID=130825 RepID=UPI001B35334B|nr:RNA-binding protein 44 [Ochotona curzoniae]
MRLPADPARPGSLSTRPGSRPASQAPRPLLGNYITVLNKQAKAVMETISGKHHPSGGGNLREGQGPEMRRADRVSVSEPSSLGSQVSDAESTCSQLSEFEDKSECICLNATYSIRFSNSQLKNGRSRQLNLQLDPGLQKGKEACFDILEHQGDEMVGLERAYEDGQGRAPEEDSRQEYHSVEECVSDHASPDRTKGPCGSHMLNSGDSGWEAQRASPLEEHVLGLGRGSVLSLDSLEVCEQEDSPSGSAFQDAARPKGCREQKHEQCQARETGAALHAVGDDVIPAGSFGNHASASETAFLNSQNTLKTKIYAEKVKAQITEIINFCGNTTAENKLLQHLENASTLAQARALEASLQPHDEHPTSWTFRLDESVISAREYSRYRSVQSGPDVSVSAPRSAARHGQAAREASSPEAGSRSTSTACCPATAGARPLAGPRVVSYTVTVDQTVDVSTDFRACFTTSRATSARPRVASASCNTDITMMNKKRPSECRRETQRSVACNTEWSYGQEPHMAATEGPRTSASVGSLKPNGNVLNKDSQELRNTFDTTDFEKHPERDFQLCKDTKRTLPSVCCEKMKQRALSAELHLLDIHYQLCHRHCCELQRLLTDKGAALGRNLPSGSARKELGSALQSVLGALEVRYACLKDKVEQGIPLEELPPLSIESKLLSGFSAFASRLMKEDSQVSPVADVAPSAQDSHGGDVPSSLKKTLSQVTLLAEQDTSPNKDGLETGDINVEFSQLKLDDEDCRHYREMGDSWFDARENLTGVDPSGTRGSQVDPEQGAPEGTPEMKAAEPAGRDRGFLIHVGGLCPSVSEADLRSYFQKYQVSEISIDDSSDYRYASLAFKKNNDAKMAVKEMNGTEINGKFVSVRLVKTPGDPTSPLSSQHGDRVSLTSSEKNPNGGVGSVPCASSLPRSRPRPTGAEPDSECCPLAQQVKKNCRQIESAKSAPHIPVQFIPPNTLNLRSFTKIMRKLAELHPEVSRDQLLDALQAVRADRCGLLNGLSISTIVEMTSSKLQSSASREAPRRQ